MVAMVMQTFKKISGEELEFSHILVHGMMNREY